MPGWSSAARPQLVDALCPTEASVEVDRLPWDVGGLCMTEAKPANPAPEPFNGILLRHRGRTGVTQRQLAARVGVNRRALQDWEEQVNYPSAQRLQALLAALLEADGFIRGQEADEAATLWAAALLGSTRMHVPFDHG